MKLLAISFVVFSAFFILQCVSADVPVVVKLTPYLERSVDYHNFSEEINNGYQKFVTNIYNIGSIGCLTRLRFDIYNSTNHEIVDTVWSNQIPMEAGAFNTFETYWYPYNISGRLYSQMRIYQCNDIFEGPVSEFNVNNILDDKSKKTDLIEEKILEVKKLSNSESWIELEIKANSDLENIVFYTKSESFGWIFEDKKIDKINKNEIKYLKINYVPEIWKESKISINIFDEENNYFTNKDFYLEENNNLDTKDIIITILGIIIFLLIFLKIRGIKKKRKKKK